MTYIDEIRSKINNNEGTIKAVIYARVSTDNDAQKDSCDNQVALAQSFIGKHPNIVLTGIYVDDGISGKNDFNRPQYNLMLHDLRTKHFDIIITKSLSRLNRDEFNSLALKSILLDFNSTIYTLEDGQIHDFEDMNSELLRSLKYAIDAMYVKQQSINGRKTQELRIQKKELSAKDISFGYKWDKPSKNILIDDDEADTVRWIFDEYVFHNATPASIYRKLKNGSFKLCERSIVNILKNERYIGCFYINKKTTKLGTGQRKSKRINLPKDEWVLCQRPDLQIVDEEIFKLAQMITVKRAEWFNAGVETGSAAVQSRFQGRHIFSHIIFCAVCGKPYRFDASQDKNKTPCYRIGNHSNCISPINRLTEKDVSDITKASLRYILSSQDALFTSLEKVLEECVRETQANTVNEAAKLKKTKALREAQIDSLIETLSEGGLTEASKSRIKDKLNSIMKEVEELAEQISAEENNEGDNTLDKDKILARIRKSIEELKNFDYIDRDKILNYLERIDVQPNGNIDITMKSGHHISKVITDSGDKSLHHDILTGKIRNQDALYS